MSRRDVTRNCALKAKPSGRSLKHTIVLVSLGCEMVNVCPPWVVVVAVPYALAEYVRWVPYPYDDPYAVVFILVVDVVGVVIVRVLVSCFESIMTKY